MATRPSSGARRKSAPNPEQNAFVQNSIRFMQAASLFQRRRDSSAWQPITKGYVKLQVTQVTTSTPTTRSVRFTMTALEGSNMVLNVGLSPAMRVKRTTTFIQIILSSSDSNMYGVRFTAQEHAVQLETCLAAIAPAKPSPPPPGSADGRRVSRTSGSATSADTISVGSTGSGDTTDGPASDGTGQARKANKRPAPAPPRAASAHALTSSAPASVMTQALNAGGNSGGRQAAPPRPAPFQPPGIATASNSAPPSRSPSIQSLDTQPAPPHSANTSPTKKPIKRLAPAPPGAGTGAARKASATAVPSTIDEKSQPSATPPEMQRMRKVTSDSSMGGASPRRRAPERPPAAGGMLKAQSMQAINHLSAPEASAQLAHEAPASLPDQGDGFLSNDADDKKHGRRKSDPHGDRPPMPIPAKLKRPRSPPNLPPPPPPSVPADNDSVFDDALKPTAVSTVPEPDQTEAQLHSIGEEDEQRKSADTSPIYAVVKKKDQRQKEAAAAGGAFSPPISLPASVSSTDGDSTGGSPLLHHARQGSQLSQTSMEHVRQGSYQSEEGVDPFALPPPPDDPAVQPDIADTQGKNSVHGVASAVPDDFIPSESTVRLSAAYNEDCSNLLEDLETLTDELEGTAENRPGRSASYTVTDLGEDDIADDGLQILSIKPLEDDLAGSKSTITLSEGSVLDETDGQVGETPPADPPATIPETAQKPKKAPPKTTFKPKRSPLSAATFGPPVTGKTEENQEKATDQKSAEKDTQPATHVKPGTAAKDSESPSGIRRAGQETAGRWRSGSFDGASRSREGSPRIVVKQVSALAVAPSAVGKITPRFTGSQDSLDRTDGRDAADGTTGPDTNSKDQGSVDDSIRQRSQSDVSSSPMESRKLKPNRASSNRLVLNMLPSKKSSEKGEKPKTMLFNLPPPPTGASPATVRKQPRPLSSCRLSGEFLPPPPTDDEIGLVSAQAPLALELPSPPRNLAPSVKPEETLPPPPVELDAPSTIAKPADLALPPPDSGATSAVASADSKPTAGTPGKKKPPPTVSKPRRTPASTPQSDGPSSELAAKLQRRMKAAEQPSGAAQAPGGGPNAPPSSSNSRPTVPIVRVPDIALLQDEEDTSASMDEPDESLDEAVTPVRPIPIDIILPQVNNDVITRDDDITTPVNDAIISQSEPVITLSESPEETSTGPDDVLPPPPADEQPALKHQTEDIVNVEQPAKNATNPSEEMISEKIINTNMPPPPESPADEEHVSTATLQEAVSKDTVPEVSPPQPAPCPDQQSTEKEPSSITEADSVKGVPESKSTEPAVEDSECLTEPSSVKEVAGSKTPEPAMNDSDSLTVAAAAPAQPETPQQTVRFADDTKDTESTWTHAPSVNDDDYFLSPSVPNLDADAMCMSDSVAALDLPDIPDDLPMVDDDDADFDEFPLDDCEIIQSGLEPSVTTTSVLPTEPDKSPKDTVNTVQPDNTATTDGGQVTTELTVTSPAEDGLPAPPPSDPRHPPSSDPPTPTSTDVSDSLPTDLPAPPTSHLPETLPSDLPAPTQSDLSGPPLSDLPAALPSDQPETLPSDLPGPPSSDLSAPTASDQPGLTQSDLHSETLPSDLPGPPSSDLSAVLPSDGSEIPAEVADAPGGEILPVGEQAKDTEPTPSPAVVGPTIDLPEATDGAEGKDKAVTTTGEIGTSLSSVAHEAEQPGSAEPSQEDAGKAATPTQDPVISPTELATDKADEKPSACETEASTTVTDEKSSQETCSESVKAEDHAHTSAEDHAQISAEDGKEDTRQTIETAMSSQDGSSPTTAEARTSEDTAAIDGRQDQEPELESVPTLTTTSDHQPDSASVTNTVPEVSSPSETVSDTAQTTEEAPITTDDSSKSPDDNEEKDSQVNSEPVPTVDAVSTEEKFEPSADSAPAVTAEPSESPQESSDAVVAQAESSIVETSPSAEESQPESGTKEASAVLQEHCEQQVSEPSSQQEPTTKQDEQPSGSTAEDDTPSQSASDTTAQPPDTAIAETAKEAIAVNEADTDVATTAESKSKSDEKEEKPSNDADSAEAPPCEAPSKEEGESGSPEAQVCATDSKDIQQDSVQENQERSDLPAAEIDTSLSSSAPKDELEEKAEANTEISESSEETPTATVETEVEPAHDSEAREEKEPPVEEAVTGAASTAGDTSCNDSGEDKETKDATDATAGDAVADTPNENVVVAPEKRNDEDNNSQSASKPAETATENGAEATLEQGQTAEAGPAALEQGQAAEAGPATAVASIGEKKIPPPIDTAVTSLASPALVDASAGPPSSPGPPPLPTTSPPAVPDSPPPSNEDKPKRKVSFAELSDSNEASDSSACTSPTPPPPPPAVQQKAKPKPPVKTKKAIREGLLKRDSKTADPYDDLDEVLDDIRRDNKTRLRKVSTEKPEAKAKRREEELVDGTDMTSALFKSLKSRRFRISDTLRIKRLSGAADADEDWGDGDGE
ncbi:mucin-17-like [Sycon ciliatum]|uniref:mucin-17-like n=1 Tax=Sycon ciliatum TaxID=27933 RepID=UPI0031F60629